MTVDLNTYADRCFRHVTLGWVSRWCGANGKRLRLYGRGWEGHAEFGQWAAGVAEPGEEARAIYQARNINWQMTEAGFIHPRSLAGWAAGVFFLTRNAVADGVGSADVRTLYEVARWAVETGIKTEAALDTAGDAAMREKVRRVREYFRRLGGGEIWHSLQV